ncbi:MAG: oligosaccharide flippase family protein, partial [Pseudomonadota bacterium]
GAAAVPAALARRKMNFRSLALRTIFARLTATGIAVAMLLEGHGAEAVVLQAVLSVSIAAVLLLFMEPLPLRPRIVRSSLISMLRFAGAAVGAQFLLFASGRLVTLIVANMLGTVAAGTWNVALRLVEPFHVMTATLIGQYMVPLFSRSQADLQRIKELYLQATRLSCVVTVPMFIGLGLCAKQMILLFVGEEWLAAEQPMVVICLGFAVIASRQLIENALTSLGRPELNLGIQATAIVISVVGFIYGARYGLLEGVIGWSLRVLPFVLLGSFFLRWKAGVGIFAQVGALLPTITAVTVMSAGVLYVQRYLDGIPSSKLLAISVSVGVLLTALTVLTTDPGLRKMAFGAMRLRRS